MGTVMKRTFGNNLDFVNLLESSRIRHRIGHVRDAVMVELAIPGERREVEFFEDGPVDAERFVSTGEIEDEAALDRITADP
jgi:hypothetical protein